MKRAGLKERSTAKVLGEGGKAGPSELAALGNWASSTKREFNQVSLRNDRVSSSRTPKGLIARGGGGRGQENN